MQATKGIREDRSEPPQDVTYIRPLRQNQEMKVNPVTDGNKDKSVKVRREKDTF